MVQFGSERVLRTLKSPAHPFYSNICRFSRPSLTTLVTLLCATEAHWAVHSPPTSGPATTPLLVLRLVPPCTLHGEKSRLRSSSLVRVGQCLSQERLSLPRRCQFPGGPRMSSS